MICPFEFLTDWFRRRCTSSTPHISAQWAADGRCLTRGGWRGSNVLSYIDVHWHDCSASFYRLVFIFSWHAKHTSCETVHSKFYLELLPNNLFLSDLFLCVSFLLSDKVTYWKHFVKTCNCIIKKPQTILLQRNNLKTCLQMSIILTFNYCASFTRHHCCLFLWFCEICVLRDIPFIHSFRRTEAAFGIAL